MLHVFLPRKIDNRESRFDKFAHRMRFSCCHDIIIRRVVLQHQPHRMDIILCAAPIPFAFQVPEHKLCNEPSRNARSRTRDFASHKVLRAPRRLVIVKNAVADKQPVGFAINSRQLRGERLSAAVRTRRSQRRVLGLRNFECISENFRSRRVIKSGGAAVARARFQASAGSLSPLLRSSILEFQNSGQRGFVRQDDTAPSDRHRQQCAARAVGEVAVMEK